ncbi:DUF6143 family protein [Bhargavaea beijingensis]|uniref:Uncharacterized protein n=1 Tax=Bhargavaea beijingensis TaxID=426756 RepID=A0A1G7G6G5_9BACL|nr:DUF6143 family protein [Bhargavaea beijingensis]MCW1927406.1 DUF6143 family protein [Bhargavaea beijingensis]RSK30049.1 hypothetical protein EJA12_10070 [Bhargavaea beijingensis]SDE83697.1 hypothetical protein SAMN04488126_12414 [Bhargavaea beijingensis]
MERSDQEPLSKTVNIPNPLYQSLEGRYFVGQTERISVGKGKNAWGGLINPFKSGIDLFVNAFTITNHSDLSVEAEIWFNALPFGESKISRKVTPANTALFPLPEPEVKIAYAEGVRGIPEKGVMAFRRIVPPKSTLASDEDGKFIFPPNGSFTIVLIAPANGIIRAEIAFGWFEEKIKKNRRTDKWQ